MAQPKQEGLSLQTLVIASLSSLAAAIVVHEFWQGGAIVGAAVTPVIVALVGEGLRRPVQVIQTTRTRRDVPVRDPGLPPESRARPSEDRFGIWEAERPSWHERLSGKHLKIAIATGLVAFGIAAFFLTGAELVFGGGSGGDKFTIVPGKQRKHDNGDKSSEKTQTQTEPTGEEQSQTAPEQTVTVTTPPAEEQPPAETTPSTTPPGGVAPQPDEQAPSGGEQAPTP